MLPLTRLYEQLLIVLVALLPAFAICYLYFAQDAALRYVDHDFHEIAIAIAILLSGFVSYVTWRCYVTAGEPLLRWATLSVLSFTLIYSLHGLLTPMSDHHLFLFLFYGPVSRLVMAAIFAGRFVCVWKMNPHPPAGSHASQILAGAGLRASLHARHRSPPGSRLNAGDLRTTYPHGG